MENKRYRLLGADGRTYESETRGKFGGHSRTRVYGTETCSSALRALAKRYRVFFAAGYRRAPRVCATSISSGSAQETTASPCENGCAVVNRGATAQLPFLLHVAVEPRVVTSRSLPDESRTTHHRKKRATGTAPWRARCTHVRRSCRRDTGGSGPGSRVNHHPRWGRSRRPGTA